jgi:hypothetical protein
MELKTALAVFEKLEQFRCDQDQRLQPDTDSPIFDVRLDAITTGDYWRDYRLRVTFGSGINYVTAETIEMLTEAAKPFFLSWELQNSAVELTG